MKTKLFVWIATGAAILSAEAQSSDHLRGGFREWNFLQPLGILVPSEGYGFPSPSQIMVANLRGSVVKVTVTLSNVVERTPEDLWVWLVGPTGEKAGLWINEGSNLEVAGATLIFDDDAASPLPDDYIVSGTYRPSVNGEYLNDPLLFNPLRVFNGQDPNGVWSLFVFNRNTRDDVAGGCICGGWGVAITTEPRRRGDRHSRWHLSQTEE